MDTTGEYHSHSPPDSKHQRLKKKRSLLTRFSKTSRELYRLRFSDLRTLSVVFMFHKDPLSFTFPFWTFSAHLISVILTTDAGQLSVVGPLQPIVAAPGDDVILPCHVEPHYNVERLTVEWSKPDMKPDPSDRLSRVDYVYLYRDRRPVSDMQIPSYVGRTELFTDDLKHGNISLKIKSVTLEDGGRFRCFIPKLKSPVKESILVLVVDPNFVKTATTETPLHPNTLQTPDAKNETTGSRSHLAAVIPAVVLSVFVILGCVAGFLHKHKCPKQNLLKNDPATNTLSHV